jgi:hypothetical protein
VRLGLNIGQYDDAFVDAYYGPDSLRPKGLKSAVFPKDSLLAAVDSLLGALKTFAADEKNDTLLNRSKWMSSQLVAFGRRIKIFQVNSHLSTKNQKSSSVPVAPSNTEDHFKSLLNRLDSVLPGKGTIPHAFKVLPTGSSSRKIN